MTHSILHGFNYSPPAAGFPGWVRYGSYFNEHNPWWPYVRHWMDYKARLSWLLQQADPQANIAILHPLADLWKQNGMQRFLTDYPATCRVVAAPAKGEDLLTWFQGVSEKFGLVPDVAFNKASPLVSQSFHKTGDRDVFFVVNSSREKAATVKARFRTTGLAPWVWDPETGTRRLLAWDDAPNALTFRLEPAESRVIVFEPAAVKPSARDAIPSDAGAQIIAGSWSVDLRHMNGSRSETSLDAPRDLGKLVGLSAFAGQAIYQLKFDAAEAAKVRFRDLGTVREISEVTLNGRSLGTRWHGRHVYSLPEVLKATGNELEIRVTTVSGNYAKSLTTNETAQRWTNKLPVRPMGLLGPVRLLCAK